MIQLDIHSVCFNINLFVNKLKNNIKYIYQLKIWKLLVLSA